ncbi:hypothetical protein P7K49_004384, partial [Saguinus oedipus]
MDLVFVLCSVSSVGAVDVVFVLCSVSSVGAVDVVFVTFGTQAAGLPAVAYLGRLDAVPFPSDWDSQPARGTALGHLGAPTPLGAVQRPSCSSALPGGSHAFYVICLPSSLPALIRYIRPVFVSRSDQDSRRKTVEEIKRRAQSNGKWPQ